MERIDKVIVKILLFPLILFVNIVALICVGILLILALPFSLMVHSYDMAGEATNDLYSKNR